MQIKIISEIEKELEKYNCYSFINYSNGRAHIFSYRYFFEKLSSRNTYNITSAFANLNAIMAPEFPNSTNTTNNYSQPVTSTDPVNPMQWPCITNDLTNSQHDVIENFQFWFDGVFQFVIGCIGIMSNIMAILILIRSRMMESIFHQFLTCLLILHSIYIACEMSIETIYPSWYRDIEKIAKIKFTIYMYFILQPVGKSMLYSSTFFTSLMARQRYIASCKPVQYRQLMLTKNHQMHLIQNLMIVLVTSALVTFPIYLETSIEDRETGRLHELNATHFKYVSNINRDPH